MSTHGPAVAASDPGRPAHQLRLPPRRVAAVAHALMQAHYVRNGGWYPTGGGQALSDALVEAVEARGGDVRPRT